MVVLFIIGVSLFTLPLFLAWHNVGLNLLINLLVRIACLWWALETLEERNPSNPDDTAAELLLDEAVKLESTDMSQAITKYEEVVEKHPNSPASTAAKACLRTLKLNQG